MTDVRNNRLQFKRLITQDVYAAVYRFSYRLTGNRQDTEDLCQEALARAYLRMDQLRDEKLIKSWLFSIVQSLFIDRSRKGKLNTVDLSSEELSKHSSSENSQFDVRHAIANLPDQQRVVIELFHYDELSLNEIAEIENTSVNTIKQRLFRARRTLKLQMVDEEEQMETGKKPLFEEE